MCAHDRRSECGQRQGSHRQGDQRYEVISNIRDQRRRITAISSSPIATLAGFLHDVAAVVDSNENIRNAGSSTTCRRWA